MSYMSGMMMGMAVGKGLGSMLMGGAASGGLSALGAGASRLLGGAMGRGGASAFGSGMGRGDASMFGSGMGRGGSSAFGSSGMGRGGASAFGGGMGRGASRGDNLDLGDNLFKFLKGGSAKRNTAAFTLARSMPGRRRYYAKALLGNEALAAEVEKALAQLDCMDQVKANPVSGSLLLVYHGDESKIDAIAGQLAARVFTVTARPAAAAAASDASAAPVFPERKPEGLAALGIKLRSLIGAVNYQLKVMTKGLLDLPSLLSLVFTIQGLEKIIVSKQLPSGPQLIWWAFSLLRGWRIA